MLGRWDTENHHEQQCKAARRHPLSLVDNIKIYFINNTHHFNTRLNYIINSLTAMGGRDRPPFNELRVQVVSPRFFVRSQRLMARKIAELFSMNCGVRFFYALVASMS
jgi:hypothetical protein